MRANNTLYIPKKNTNYGIHVLIVLALGPLYDRRYPVSSPAPTCTLYFIKQKHSVCSENSSRFMERNMLRQPRTVFTRKPM